MKRQITDSISENLTDSDLERIDNCKYQCEKMAARFSRIVRTLVQIWFDISSGGSLSRNQRSSLAFISIVEWEKTRTQQVPQTIRIPDRELYEFRLESHTGRIEIIPPIFVVLFTLFSPLNINGHMLSGVMA